MSMCCLTGAPCFVDPCAKCPDRGADFKTWLETYKPGTAFDHGDMAACWHAAQRSYRATFARPEALFSGWIACKDRLPDNPACLVLGWFPTMKQPDTFLGSEVRHWALDDDPIPDAMWMPLPSIPSALARSQEKP